MTEPFERDRILESYEKILRKDLNERAGYSGVEGSLKDLDKVAAKAQKAIDKAVSEVDKRINMDMKNVGPDKSEYYNRVVELLRDKYPEIAAALGHED